MTQKQVIYQPTFLLGTIKGLPLGSKIYLNQVNAKGRTDSLLTSGEDFRFALPLTSGDIIFIRYTFNAVEQSLPVFLMPGADVNVAVTPKGYSFSGAKLAIEQNKFTQGLFQLYYKSQWLDSVIKANSNDGTKVAAWKESLNGLQQERKAYLANWVKMHRSSPFTAAVLYLYSSEMEMDSLDTLYKLLTPAAKKNNPVSDRVPYMIADAKAWVRMKPGDFLKDFALPDTAGNMKSFSSIKGKGYVLLDFWASWCAPCRASTPEIIELLHKYKDKNLSVISISADDDKTAWKEAIRQDRMDWPQLSDLKGTEGGFVKENYIYAFPTYILIGPDGIIITKPYNIDRVKELLAKIFDEPKI